MSMWKRIQSRKPRPLLGLSAFALSVTLVSIWLLGAAVDPHTRPMTHSEAAGGIINRNLTVALSDTRMCACWSGPNGQMEKKVKFKITNNSSDNWIDLYGGPDASVYLYVAYPDSFVPNVKMPRRTLGMSGLTISPQGSPAGRQVYLSSLSDEVRPDRVAGPVEKEMGTEDGWSAWAIPANPNEMSEWSGNELTYPTYVTQQWLGPGETYSDDRNGIGAWVFYVPLPSAIAWITGESLLPSTMLSSGQMDTYYRVLGVGIRARDGSTIGFAPVPPESELSNATDF